ncbi:MAG: hypothetical protein ACI8TE_001720 [Francisella sp.]|jgi:hypothetical protein
MLGFEAIFIYVIIMGLFILYSSIFYIKETSTVRVKISYETVFKNYAERGCKLICVNNYN